MDPARRRAHAVKFGRDEPDRRRGVVFVNVEFSTSLTRPTEQMTLHVSAATDVGCVRQVNEDSFYALAPVFFVADGMGGHQYGDRASQAVAQTFAEDATGEDVTDPDAVLTTIGRANRIVQGLVSEEDGPGAVAGTTLSGIALVDLEREEGDEEDAPEGLHWMIFNIGDSRVYGWNGRSLEQITTDHSAVQEMVKMGLISSEEALVHPDRNVITRAVGSEDRVDADVWFMPTRGRQVFLICSDGLGKELDDLQLARLIRQYAADPDSEVSLAEMLVQTAVERGGRDNISVVMVDSVYRTADGAPAKDDDDTATLASVLDEEQHEAQEAAAASSGWVVAEEEPVLDQDAEAAEDGRLPGDDG